MAVADVADRDGFVRDDRPSRLQAEEAVRTLIRWAGDDPDRAGLLDTPRRVINAYDEWFAGYHEAPIGCSSAVSRRSPGTTRSWSSGTSVSYHIASTTWRRSSGAHIRIPADRVVGISKLARLVHAFARRLQIQERMTAEIADALARVLAPRGVAVVISQSRVHGDAACASQGVSMVTSRMLGVFRDQPETRQEFLASIALNRDRQGRAVSSCE